jgi:hypothetical protein
MAKQASSALASMVKRRNDDGEDSLEVVALSGEIKEVNGQNRKSAMPQKSRRKGTCRLFDRTRWLCSRRAKRNRISSGEPSHRSKHIGKGFMVIPEKKGPQAIDFGQCTRYDQPGGVAKVDMVLEPRPNRLDFVAPF